MTKKKKKVVDNFDSETSARLKEKESEDQREEARKEIEKDEPIKKRGKFITFIAQLLGLAPQIIGVLKDTNVIKDRSKK